MHFVGVYFCAQRGVNALMSLDGTLAFKLTGHDGRIPVAAIALQLAMRAVQAGEFEGKRAIQRHQQVYATLGAKMHTDEVHALSMKTYTPAEWAARD